MPKLKNQNAKKGDQMSFRCKVEMTELVVQIGEDMGVSNAEACRRSIKNEAKRRGIPVPSKI